MSAFAFRLKEPRDLLAKLQRELDRLRESADHQSKDHKHQSDHAFNFAITAWHMVEWVWKSDEAKNPGRKERFGVNTLNKFRSKVLADCHDLEICRDVANGSKHFRLDSQGDQTRVVGTSAKVTQDSGIVRSIVQPMVKPIVSSIIGYYEEQLVIKLSDGQRVEALAVFEKVLEYWVGFFEETSAPLLRE